MTPTHNHPRRRDRSKDEAWIKALLRRGEAGVMSAVIEGRPFSLPRIYAFDEGRTVLYLHGAFGGDTGRLVSQAGAGEGVAMTLTVYEMGRLLPAAEAAEFGVEYASVVVSGRAYEVEDLEEAERGLRLLMEKYAPHMKAGEDYQAITPEEVLRTSVLRVDIDAWSGKEKAEAPDFPGAYWFKDVR